MHAKDRQALDEAVIEGVSEDACNINNEGLFAQVQYLFKSGWTEQSIRDRLGLKEGT